MVPPNRAKRSAANAPPLCVRRAPWIAAACALVLAAACRDSAGDPSQGATGSGGTSSTSVASGGSTSAGGEAGAGGSAPFVPYCNRGPASAICNPYGLALDHAEMSPGTYWGLLETTFRVNFYRPETLFLDQFVKDPTSCAGCEAAVAEGLYLVLVIRHDGSANTPTNPPPDLDVYRAALGGVVDRYKGALASIVIEDEADSPASYAGSAAEYLAELKTGCDAAHAKGVRCTDSGVSSTNLLFWLARYYARAGSTGEALRILRTAENNLEVPAIFKDGQATAEEVEAFLAMHEARIDRAAALLTGLRGADVDAANFHWYESNETTLAEVVAILRAETGCYRVVTSEIGQRSDHVLETEFKLVLTKELGLPLIVWASSDDDQARSLVDATGALRSTGERFAQVVDAASCVD